MKKLHAADVTLQIALINHIYTFCTDLLGLPGSLMKGRVDEVFMHPFSHIQ